MAGRTGRRGLQATLNQGNSQYVGTWHYPEGGPPDATENIAYTRVEDNG